MHKQCRQLIDDQRRGQIPFRVDEFSKPVDDDRVAGRIDILRSRVICQHQQTRLFLIGNLLVKVIPRENPVGLSGRQAGDEDLQRTDLPLQLVKGFGAKSRHKRREQRNQFRLLEQRLEDLLIGTVQQRQHMREGGILAILVAGQEIDTGRQEVDGRLREELIGAARFIAFFQGFDQRLSRF